MKLYKIILMTLLFSFSYLQECPPIDTLSISPSQNYWDFPVLNSWEDFDIMTWNLKLFPLSSSTLNNVNEVISDVLPDVILFQEINDLQEYENLASTLYAYDFIHSGDDMYGLAMAIRKDSIDLISYSTLFPSNGYEFAWRYPLSAEIIWNCGDSYFALQVINVHFKCCDDGFDRRIASSEILSNYINDQLNINNNKKIIIGGDLNDDITDSFNNNSLSPLLDNNNIYFTTIPIASNSYFDSYPSYSSFLDHIIITDNINDSAINTQVNTIRIDDYVGWSNFQNNISDHRPVTWSMTVNYDAIPLGLLITEIMNNPEQIIDSYGEWFEIYNYGNQDINLYGYILEDSDGDQHIISENLNIYPNQYLVLGIEDDISLNGGIELDYKYDNFFLGNFWDEIILKHPYGIVMDEVFYDYNGIFPNSPGYSMSLNDFNINNENGSNWLSSESLMASGDYGTPGNDNFLNCENNLDINLDQLINVLDVILLVNYIIGESNNENFCSLDFDSDGNINIIDVVYMINYILNTN